VFTRILRVSWVCFPRNSDYLFACLIAGKIVVFHEYLVYKGFFFRILHVCCVCFPRNGNGHMFGCFGEQKLMALMGRVKPKYDHKVYNGLYIASISNSPF
jgi:hypothetical protein